MARFTTSNITIGTKLEPKARKGSATITDIVNENGKTLAKVSGVFTEKGIRKPFVYTLNMLTLNSMFRKAE